MTESGDRLGSRYTLEQPVGSGAMGQVWRAHDENGHQVAVKMLHPHLTSNQAVVRRFIEERQLLTSIHSPSVVQVLDMVMEGDKLGIVMEYVDGPDLGSELKVHARQHELMQERYAASLGAEICDGLAAVHAVRICHRDVKPANVLLAHGPDGGWHPKLTDFGVSKILDSTLEGSTAFAGTPNYVAPEIIRGQTPAPASDLYSFGVMLYEMVAGRLPFPAPNREAVLLAHLERQPPRPVGISDAMWYVISCCMAKQIAGRPRSAAAIAESLRRLAEGQDPGVLVAPGHPGDLPSGLDATVPLAATQVLGQGWTPAPAQQTSATGSTGSAGSAGSADLASSPAGLSLPGMSSSGSGTRPRSEGGTPSGRRSRVWIPVLLMVLIAAVVVAAIAFDRLGSRQPVVGQTSPQAGVATSSSSSDAPPSTQQTTQQTTQTVTQPAQSVTQPTETVTLPAGSTLCSAKIGVGTSNTSCEFAANVAAAIPASPGDQFTVTAYSPVTHENYTLDCTSGQYYTCVKSANNIKVFVIR